MTLLLGVAGAAIDSLLPAFPDCEVKSVQVEWSDFILGKRCEDFA
jgi:hypothetical protein